MVGKPVVKGTRIPVELVLRYLAENPNFDDLFADYPRLTVEDVKACFAYAPVRQDIIEKFGDKWTEPPNYIGNGPFKLTEWAHQDHIALEANPNYLGDQA